MRIGRIDHDGEVRHGTVDTDAATFEVCDGDPFDIVSLRASGTVLDLAECRLLPPVQPSKILAIGRNYAAHAEEMGLAMGSNPSVFIKPLQTLVPQDGTVVLPPTDVSSKVEHEAEVAVVIGRRARGVAAADWADYVWGFTAANDVSARDVQKADPQITRGKGFDTFCPLGPYVDTDFARDATTTVVCRVNGEERQRGHLGQLIFSVPFLIEWLSSWTTLEPGDVILTGSPAGTGPMAPGDEVEIEVSGVGTLRHGVEQPDE
jgi:2-keto-4-pentenoate hydratase/2-oxohepta-3-ene-1,7-dioic acid hydratase in catechol pathway